MLCCTVQEHLHWGANKLAARGLPGQFLGIFDFGDDEPALEAASLQLTSWLNNNNNNNILRQSRARIWSSREGN